MLYREFVEGTGCKDNDHNYKVYKDLEIMYMNSDLSKAQIYEYGKKLVDNNYKSEKELAVEARVKAEIDECKSYIAYYKAEIARADQLKAIEDDPIWKKKWGQDKAYYKEQVTFYKNRISALKWVLA